MIVKCTDCHVSYSVDDSKVTNKRFGFTCPKCGASVIIDNRTNMHSHSSASSAVGDASASGAMPSSKTSMKISTIESDLDRELSSAIDDMPTSDEINGILNDVEGNELSKRTDEPGSGTDDFVDFELSNDDEEILRGSSKQKTTHISPGEEEGETLSLDDFQSSEDIDIEAESRSGTGNDDSTELDLDSLAIADPVIQASVASAKSSDYDAASMEQINVDQDDFKPLEEDLMLDGHSIDLGDDVKSEDILKESGEDTDESITIDLDSLDIQLDEGPPEIKSGDASTDAALGIEVHDRISHSLDQPEDESITLDLDTLDITLAEVEEFKEGISVDEEDERLTLEDAGISIDDLEADRADTEKIELSQESDEELKLSIDEIDPSLSVEVLGEGQREQQDLISEIDSDELPEIDFDRLDSEPTGADIAQKDFDLTISAAAPVAGKALKSPEDEDYLDIETSESYSRYKADIESYGSHTSDTVPKGAINFSIDYSLNHSRVGSLLRLLGVYYLALIPHYIILFIYSALSQIIGFINWFIVLFMGQFIEDFMEIQEKTLRYVLSISACQSSVADETPIFAGREDIDQALQFSVIYPSAPSRFLAFMRISIVGIYILLLPHLIILILLSLACLFITIAGLIAILVKKRWPNILFDFMVRYYRYVANVASYACGLVDKYPTFRFE